MLGDAVKFSPIYYPASSQRRLSIYFPGSEEDYWCPLQADKVRPCFKGGSNQIFSNFPSMMEILAHVVPGSILPWVDGIDLTFLVNNHANLKMLRSLKQDFIVNPDHTFEANGFII